MAIHLAISLLLGFVFVWFFLGLVNFLWAMMESTRALRARDLEIRESYGSFPMTIQFETPNVQVAYNDRLYQVTTGGRKFQLLRIPETGKLGIATDIGTYWLSREGGYLEEGAKASDGSSYWTRSIRAHEYFGDDYLKHLDGQNGQEEKD